MKKVTKILMIISIVIIALGIATGISVSSELSSGVDQMNNLYVDGSDFTAILKAVVTFGSTLVGFIIVFYFALAVCVIWIIYGIILLIIKIVNKIKERKEQGT